MNLETEQLKAAVLNARSAVLNAKVAALQAENLVVANRGESPLYTEIDFNNLVSSSGLGYNDVVEILRGDF